MHQRSAFPRYRNSCNSARTTAVQTLESRRLFAASLDTSFNGTGYNILVDGFSDRINAVHALPDGRVLTAGVGRGTGFGVTRYTSAGVIDTSFGTNGSGAVSGFSSIQRILVRPVGGQVVLVGSSSSGSDLRIMQLTPNGQLDTTFGSGGSAGISLASDSNEVAYGATLDSLGRIVVVGDVRQGTINNGTWGGYVVRFTSGGTLDNSFSGGIQRFEYGATDFTYSEHLKDVIVHNNRIIAGGYVATTIANFQPVLIAYTDTGAPDNGFGTSGVQLLPAGASSSDGVASIAPHGAGVVAAAGTTIYATNANGSPDTTFGGGTGKVTTPFLANAIVARSGDGAIFATGSSSGNFAVMKLNNSGAADTSFGAQGAFAFDTGLTGETGYALSLSGDGRLVIGGRAVGPANDDRVGTAVARITNIDALPAWVGNGSAARWDAGTKTLTVNGAASITTSPGTDLPIVNANTSTSALTINLPAGAPVKLAALNLSNGGTATLTGGGGIRALVVNSLFIASGGKLDLVDNDLITTATARALVEGYIRTANNFGNWLGATGIFSSTAKNNPRGNTTLGLLSGAEFIDNNGGPFDGQTVSNADVLVKYTYFGDIDFNGRVEASDYNLIDFGFSNHLTGWANGDADWSGGRTDVSDYNVIDFAFATQTATL